MDLYFRKHYARQYHPVVSALVIGAIYAALGLSLLRLALTPTERRRPGL
jgi:hypothetical protein